MKTVPWETLETYLKDSQLNLRQIHVVLLQKAAGDAVTLDAAIAIALYGLLLQTGLSSPAALLGVRQVLDICQMVVEVPGQLQVVNVMDSRFLTWYNCKQPLDLETGEVVSEYMPTISVSIVLNRIHSSLV